MAVAVTLFVSNLTGVVFAGTSNTTTNYMSFNDQFIDGDNWDYAFAGYLKTKSNKNEYRDVIWMQIDTMKRDDYTVDSGYTYSWWRVLNSNKYRCDAQKIKKNDNHKIYLNASINKATFHCKGNTSGCNSYVDGKVWQCQTTR